MTDACWWCMPVGCVLRRRGEKAGGVDEEKEKEGMGLVYTAANQAHQVSKI